MIEDGDTQPSSRRPAGASTGRRGTQSTVTTSQPAGRRGAGSGRAGADGTAATPAGAGESGWSLARLMSALSV